MSSIYLGVDIGTTSAKCLALDEDGAIVGFAQHPYTLSRPREGWAEQDAEELWQALVDVVRRCVQSLADSGASASDVQALAMSTQANTMVLTAANGVPVAPAISWMDARAQQEFQDLLSGTGREFWHTETGSRLTPLSPACKVLWLRKNRPELLGEGNRIGFLPDFLAERMCGRWAMDASSASWTPFYTPGLRRWSQAACDALKIRPDALPESVEGGEILGEVLPAVAAEMGLPRGVLVMSGAFDQAAAAHGAVIGADDDGGCVLSCGTAWVLYRVAASPVLDEDGQIPLCCHVRPDQWGLVLPFPGGAVYDWFCHAAPGQDGSAVSEGQPPLFIPHLYGGLSPDYLSGSRGSMLGLSLSHTREDMRRAVMRGLACEARRNVEAAEHLAGPVPMVRLVGGAGKSDIWPSIIADVLARPVQVSDCVESACCGAARLAAGDASSLWPHPGELRVVSPDASGAQREEQGYQDYLRFLHPLADIYSRQP